MAVPQRHVKAVEQVMEAPQQATRQDGFEALVADHAPMVGRMLSALVDDPNLVADLAQETFVRAYRGLEAFRGGQTSTWLGRIAVNVARDHHRGAWNQRVLLVAEPDDEPAGADGEPEVIVLQHEAGLRIRAAMQRLPARQAEVVRLRFLLGESYVGMEALLGVPESTLRSRVKAALKRLRAELADYFAESES